MKNLGLKLLMVAAALSVAAPNRVAGADEMTEALQKALFEEEANHDLEAAIRSYQRVATQFTQQQKLAATAIYRLGECYRKLGQTNEAVAHYQRLLRDFSGETALVNLSQQNLAGLGVNTAVAVIGGGAKGGLVPATSEEEEEIRRIDTLIRNSPDLINASLGESGGSPLFKAALAGQLVVAQHLLSHGANVNVQNSQTAATPLHAATQAGHKAMVELLLKHGADVNGPDAQLLTPLHLATERGFRGIVEILLQAKADPTAASGPGSQKDGATALHIAAGAGAVDLARRLLAAGAKVDALDTRGATPLTWTIQGYRYSQSVPPNPAQTKMMAAFLIEQGAALNNVGPVPLNLLHLVVQDKDIQLLQLLLEKGADPNAAPNGTTPLHVVIDKSLVQPKLLSPTALPMMRLLLQHKADPNIPFNTGVYPLHVVAEKGLDEFAELLLQAGARVDERSRPQNGRSLTPFHVATFNGRTNLAAILLRAGANVNAEEDNYGTLLHYAAAERNLPLTAFLLEHKANPNGRNPLSQTPLHLAVSAQNREIVEMLLQQGADPNALDKEGRSPLTGLSMSAGPPGGGRLATAIPPGPIASPPRFPGRPLRSEANARPVPAGVEEIAQLLRDRGAVELPARERSIWVSRPLARQGTNFSSQWKAIFTRGTNEHNRFTLFETMAAFYGGPNPWPFPDWSKVTINRYSVGGASTGSSSLTQDVQQAFLAQDCTKDLDLNWGDVVIIPEADHKLNDQWNHLSEEAVGTLHKCLRRKVVIMIKDDRQRLSLWPRLSGFNPARAEEAGLRLGDFRLSTILDNSALLRASSDRSRVYVFRRDPSSGPPVPLVFDLTSPGPKMDDDLWIREGDVIFVPERDAPPLTEKALEAQWQSLSNSN